ncbi:hypothetical protein DET61_116131 [Marinobacter nauticus]|uniref:Uncharacterized protein n=1 Tax=Marinobacter nauticus TaxID=2743 RepID=A0A368X7X0_MARNT|nr:hypothetical protein [Marinobacter nauticus]RCW64090.1 hypothetical protein DET61_116131 [Marinobacter nauticus]
MLKKMAFVLVGLAFSAAALANPTFYGLTLGETTEAELQNQYTAQRAGVNTVTNGNMYKLDPDEIGLEGLKSVQAVFMQDGRLGAIFAKLDKNRFGDLRKSWMGSMRSAMKTSRVWVTRQWFTTWVNRRFL